MSDQQRPYIDEGFDDDDAQTVQSEPGPPDNGWTVGGGTVVTPDASGGSSLARRVQERRTQLENQKTEIFPVPGWADICGVELRLLGWKEQRMSAKRTEKVRDEQFRELYVMCDLIILATESIVEFDSTTGNPVKTRFDWVGLASAVLPEDKLPPRMTARRALLALVGDKLVPPLYMEWQEWSRGERNNVDTEVMEDFEVTQ